MRNSRNFEQWLHQRMQLFSRPAATDVVASREHVRAGILDGRRPPLQHVLNEVSNPRHDRTSSRAELWAWVAILVTAVGFAVLLGMNGLPLRSGGPRQAVGHRTTGDARPQGRVSPPPQEVSVPPSAVLPGPVFEVAAIRQEAPPLTYIRFQAEGERFTSEGTSLGALIRYAYNVASFQVVGGPEWAQDRNIQFHVQAKAEMPASTDQMRQMLQSLLTDRFKLRLLHQPKQANGYSLQVDRNGPKLKQTANLGPQGCFPFPATCTRTTMAGFAEYLSTVVLRMPVVDRTSLPGLFDLTLEWQPDSSQFGGNGGVGFFAGSPSAPSLFTALKEQLGLALQSGAVPIEMLVIEHAEMPSEN